MAQSTTDNEANLARFLLKKRLLELRDYQGSNTSMVTLYIRGHYQVSLTTKMLVDEQGKADNIKDNVNRSSVQEAMGAAIEKLKGIHKAPANGLCLFAGSVLLSDGRTKKITYLFEPPKEVGNFYKCGKQFYVESLLEQLDDSKKYGFIIIDGNGTLYGTLTGTAKKTLYTFTVQLQSKTRRGGQSANRFRALRKEQRHNYQRKASEYANEQFLDNEGKAIVDGLFIAGSAQFKSVFAESEMFDARLRAIVVDTLDIQYGMEQGFNQAIELARPHLQGLKISEDIKTLSDWMAEIAKDNNKIIFGWKETLQAYDEGVMEKLIVWDHLPHVRYTIRNGNQDRIVYGTVVPDLAKGDILISEESVVDWLIEKPKKGVKLYLVSDISSLGTQFSMGFGGLGGYLQYQWRPEAEEVEEAEDFNDFI